MSREIKATKVPPAISKSFDGKHNIEFSETSHRYKLDGKPCPGVTTIIKGGYVTSMGLVSWMKGQTAEALFSALTVPGQDGFYPRESFWPVTQEVKTDLIKEAKLADRGTAQEAADIGTVLHGFGELHSLGKVKEANDILEQVKSVPQWPLIDSCVKKYLEWDAKKRGKLVLAEALVGSWSHIYCGKIDRLDKVGNDLILRDYKTSKAIFTEQKIQLAMYRLAIKEWLGLDVKAIEILRFGKLDGEFETEMVDNPIVLNDLEQQGLRCRATYSFINQYERKTK